MTIDFLDYDWDRTKEEWSLFWQGKQDHPMVWIEYRDADTESISERQHCLAEYSCQITPEQIVDIEEKYIRQTHFLGDAFPKFILNFGPGSSAAYFGCETGAADDTAWFEKIDKPIKEIAFEIDTNNYWYQRKNAIIEVALKRWGGLVQIGYSDMGGNLDILASLRGTNELLMDICDHGDTIDKAVRDLTQAWIEIHRDETIRIGQGCPGFTSWGPMWSQGTTYMLQSDFSYMISPDMFKRFVMPDLLTCCDYLENSFYHLDGKGQLPHLDMILSIEKLKGIQWIPGAGQSAPEEWLDVLKKILNAGKLCQVQVTPEGACKLKKTLSGKGFIFHINLSNEKLSKKDASRLLDKLIT